MDNVCIYHDGDKRCINLENDNGVKILCNGIKGYCNFYTHPQKKQKEIEMYICIHYDGNGKCKDITTLENKPVKCNGIAPLSEDTCKYYTTQEEKQDNRNQDCKSDEGKYKPTLVSPELIKQVARVREYGVKKYNNDEHNWRKVEPRRYLDAAFRHLLAYQSGEENDPESGLNHLAHVACNMQFLLEFEKDK